MDRTLKRILWCNGDVGIAVCVAECLCDLFRFDDASLGLNVAVFNLYATPQSPDLTWEDTSFLFKFISKSERVMTTLNSSAQSEDIQLCTLCRTTTL